MLGIMFVDLDRFKVINDNWGHAAGDMALFEIGQHLKHQAETNSLFIARVGGDEFGVITTARDRSDVSRGGRADTEGAESSSGAFGRFSPDVGEYWDIHLPGRWRRADDPARACRFCHVRGKARGRQCRAIRCVRISRTARVILFYVSGHGYGHATRTNAVIEALLSAQPDLTIHVRTTAPPFLFDSRVRYSQACYRTCGGGAQRFARSRPPGYRRSGPRISGAI